MSTAFKFKKTSTQSAEENVLPLINIVFLLLIFFLWVGTFTVPEAFVVTPPESDNENPELASEYVVLLGQDEKIAFQNELMTLEEIRHIAAELHTDNPQAVFKIKADAQVLSGRVIEMMELLRDLGISKLALITSKSN